MKYKNREEKAKEFYKKYSNYLNGSVLDVGGDKGQLGKFIKNYTAIGLGSDNIIQHNLEKGLPYDEDSFETVVCLDVLEHLENIHFVFDELCRVSKKYTIISLPNPYKGMIGVYQGYKYSNELNRKQYGLPLNPPTDRHRWFFSSAEAENFIRYRAKKNKMEVVDLYRIERLPNLKDRIKFWIIKKISKIDFMATDFNSATLFVVLKK